MLTLFVSEKMSKSPAKHSLGLSKKVTFVHHRYWEGVIPALVKKILNSSVAVLLIYSFQFILFKYLIHESCISANVSFSHTEPRAPVRENSLNEK